MYFREFIRTVQAYSGLSDNDAEMAAEIFMETMAARLPAGELAKLSQQLPEEMAAMAWPAMGSFNDLTGHEFLERIAIRQNTVDTDLAQRQFCAVWRTVEDIVGADEITAIQKYLPKDFVKILS